MPSIHLPSFVFITTMEMTSWGGSEELWSQTALSLVNQRYKVSASLPWWPNTPKIVTELKAHDVKIFFRKRSVLDRLRNYVFKGLYSNICAKRKFKTCLKQAKLTIVSQGSNSDGLPFLQYCLKNNFPYVTIIHANSEHWWPNDTSAEMWSNIYKNAQRIYFVSEANKTLLESQLGERLINSKIVRNPYKVSFNTEIHWPSEDTFHLACVGRLDPSAKGQDILLRVLSLEKWRNRNICINFFGVGSASATLEKFAKNLLLTNVYFKGHVEKIESLWEKNHALILPSRFEGLPLAIVEAMLCGRIVITTDAGGNSEIVQDLETGFIASACSVTELDNAMERAWSVRYKWREMGLVAKQNIQQIVPAEPAHEFANELIKLTESL